MSIYKFLNQKIKPDYILYMYVRKKQQQGLNVEIKSSTHALTLNSMATVTHRVHCHQNFFRIRMAGETSDKIVGCPPLNDAQLQLLTICFTFSRLADSAEYWSCTELRDLYGNQYMMDFACTNGRSLYSECVVSCTEYYSHGATRLKCQGTHWDFDFLSRGAPQCSKYV